jgi:hypothetical protein
MFFHSEDAFLTSQQYSLIGFCKLDVLLRQKAQEDLIYVSSFVNVVRDIAVCVSVYFIPDVLMQPVNHDLSIGLCMSMVMIQSPDGIAVPIQQSEAVIGPPDVAMKSQHLLYARGKNPSLQSPAIVTNRTPPDLFRDYFRCPT